MDKVVLRRWCDGDKEVIALFPNLIAGRGLVTSYEHVGQHGSADRRVVIARTRPVPPEDIEGKVLLAELREIGYEV